jgi:twitching motility protein PilT
MQAGTKFGMQTMNQALFRAYTSRQISLEEAMVCSSDTIELEQMLGERAASMHAARSAR